MIRQIKRPVHTQLILHENCPHCQKGELLFTGYSKMLLVGIFPFASGKDMTVQCTSCKKAYLFYMMGELGVKAQQKALQMKNDIKHPWFAYIGYALIALVFIIALFDEGNKI